jgi:hypothetical protein
VVTSGFEDVIFGLAVALRYRVKACAVVLLSPLPNVRKLLIATESNKVENSPPLGPLPN